MKLHRAIGLILAVSFAIVGLIFLFIPGQVVVLFNDLSQSWSMTPAPPFETGLFHILAVAYMYVVTVLAYFMWRRPKDVLAPLLLANAKLASAALSFAAFFAGKGYLILLANGIVDGFLGIVVAVLYLRLFKGAGNIRLAFLNMFMPKGIRGQKLAELTSITAKAFGREAPEIAGKTSEECLRIYAEFTAQAAADAIRECDGDAQRRLFEGALEYGKKLRQQLGITSEEQFGLACELLYRAIEIDFKWRSAGQITVSRCFFAEYYSPEVCRVMSSMDAGLVAGLSGGRLSFSQRITEGNSCCLASFTPADVNS